MTDEPDPYASPAPGSTPPEQPPPYAPPPYAPPPYGQPPYASQGTNGFAIASLICAFFCSPLGIIFGLIARSQIKQRGQGGSGLATAGIVLSIIFLVLGIVLASQR